MTATYNAISTTTLSSNAGTVSIGSIPSGYTDILIVVYSKDVRVVNGVCDLSIRVNNESGSIYYASTLNDAGGFTNQGATTFPGAQPGASNPYCVSTYHFNDYLNTNKARSCLFKVDSMYSGNGNNRISSGYASGITAALTSVQFIGEQGILAGSVFTVYGIKAE